MNADQEGPRYLGVRVLGRGAPGGYAPRTGVPGVDPWANTVSMPASLRCWAVIGVGAPVSGSWPEAAFGNAITSRIESRPVSSIISRSQPNAMPPWGGGPNR